MHAKRPNQRRIQLALVALAEMKGALQQAHFAARELEEVIAPASTDRSSDRIHALRTAAGNLAGEIERALLTCREVDLRPACAEA